MQCETFMEVQLESISSSKSKWKFECQICIMVQYLCIKFYVLCPQIRFGSVCLVQRSSMLGVTNRTATFNCYRLRYEIYCFWTACGRYQHARVCPFLIKSCFRCSLPTTGDPCLFRLSPVCVSACFVLQFISKYIYLTGWDDLQCMWSLSYLVVSELLGSLVP